MNDYNHKEALEKAKREIEAANGENLELENNNIEKKDKNPDILEIKISTGDILVLNFEKITGDTIQKVKDSLQKIKKKSKGFSVDELDDLYYMLIAEKASGVHYEHFLKLKAKDFLKVRNEVRDFLLED